MKTTHYIIHFCTILCLGYFSCSSSGPAPISPEEVVSTLQKRLIQAQEGETILLPEGTFSFQRPLSLNDVPGITIKGAGKGKTILSFKEQIEGAEGFAIKNVKGITLEGFTVADSKGDAIKIQASEGVIMRDLETTWTEGALPTNGGYGLYPVHCTNVLMENCEASYAMDAGIYVGQSTNVIVRNNYVHHNVAGLEIENTRNGEVYENTAKFNTAGMLIFDMPDVPQANGYKIKFYNNVMEDNNEPNFSAPGIVVNMLPPGTGMLLMAHTQLEVYENTIKNHNTIGIALTSWLFNNRPFESEEYDPYCTEVYVHNNVIEEGGGPSDTSTDFGKLFTALFGGEKVDILVDGIFKPETLDESGNPTGICFQNNGEISFANLNAGKGPTPEAMMQNMDRDMSKFDCELAPVEVEDLGEWLLKD
ncbi:MAG: right-handed parallel beta-helix repeat-containing protein [Bacteroidetes bacterium]|nr:right-handed parallel beta-helix repeat-containing protein [Bacteroidota bacterium]